MSLKARINYETATSGFAIKIKFIFLTKVPMIHLAMDVSKEEIVFYDDSSKQHYIVSNSLEDIKSFLKQHNYNPQDTLIGCEATADFHRESCLAGLELGFQVKVLNPILTKQIINATVRKKKTDYSDAVIIAKLLANGEGNFVSKKDFEQKKRTILRTEQKLVQCASDLKRIKLTLKQKSKTMDVTEALNAIERCIEFLTEEANQLTEKATNEQDRQEEILDSIPGFGQKLAAIISTEAGDIKRFPSASQFKAYAGIDPIVSQSGNKSHNGRMTKRGNPILRHALFLAANVARQYDPDLKAFYDKKRAEGKSYRHAVCTISRKLCERIYAIVLKNELYEVKAVI